ncbi:MAG: PAS/PAC sensor [Planctomycetota bacterium]|nr:MAG: PAS/PAC sensor [Planctomycetota bacterium]
MNESPASSEPLHNAASLQSRFDRMGDALKGIRAAEAAADAARRFAEAIIETVREPLLVLSADLRIMSANRAFFETFRVLPGDTIGWYLYEIGDRQWDLPELRRLLGEILPRDSHFEDFLVDHDFVGVGRKTMLLNARRILEPREERATILLAIEDITARRRAEEKLVAAAITDPLTGLFNRRGLFERVRHLVARGRQAGERFHLLFLDLDDLKSINDRLGHEEGDRALTDAAGVLTATFRESDVIARIGGDEFVVAPVGSSQDDGCAAVVRLQTALDLHNRDAGRAFQLSMSAGISVYDPAIDPNVGKLIAQGDAAMYRVKRSRHGA